MNETWESINQWCDDTFGLATVPQIIARAKEEFEELEAAGADHAIEAADVVICLCRIPGFAEALQRKMAINRTRKWRLVGNGTGYHIPPCDSGSDRNGEDAQAAECGASQSGAEGNRQNSQALMTERLKPSQDDLIAANLLLNARSHIQNLEDEVERLTRERDTPETQNFMQGVPLEAAHQRARWGSDHDAGKTPFDWFWLVGYLAQKAASSAVAGDVEKAKHHTISTAAALCNWHAALAGESTSMRPGIAPPSSPI